MSYSLKFLSPYNIPAVMYVELTGNWDLFEHKLHCNLHWAEPSSTGTSLPSRHTLLPLNLHLHKTTLSVGPCLSLLGKHTHRLTHTHKGKTPFHLKIPSVWLTRTWMRCEAEKQWAIPCCQNGLLVRSVRYCSWGLANNEMSKAMDSTFNKITKYFPSWEDWLDWWDT